MLEEVDIGVELPECWLKESDGERLDLFPVTFLTALEEKLLSLRGKDWKLLLGVTVTGD